MVWIIVIEKNSISTLSDVDQKYSNCNSVYLQQPLLELLNLEYINGSTTQFWTMVELQNAYQ